MKKHKIVKTVIAIYFSYYVLLPTMIYAADALKKSKRVKEFEKDIELKRQGIITVKYEEI